MQPARRFDCATEPQANLITFARRTFFSGSAGSANDEGPSGRRESRRGNDCARNVWGVGLGAGHSPSGVQANAQIL